VRVAAGEDIGRPPITDARVRAIDECFGAEVSEAGAAPLAAALKDATGQRRRIGVILTGGNVDAATFARILAA